MKIMFRTTVLTIATLVASSAAFAAETPVDVRAICKSEIESHCKDVKPGEGRIRACLMENSKKLSKECLKAVQTPPAQPAPIKEGEKAAAPAPAAAPAAAPAQEKK